MKKGKIMILLGVLLMLIYTFIKQGVMETLLTTSACLVGYGIITTTLHFIRGDE